MINEKIEHFSFWQPIVFTLSDNPGSTTASKWAFLIGSLADQFASLNQQTISVDAVRIDASKLYFEVRDIQDVALWKTALKISLYILFAGNLLCVALAIKAVFKAYLNHCKVLTKPSPNLAFAEREIGKTKIVLLYGSLTDETADAIVNAANAQLVPLGGVCGAIHNNAGDTPFDECAEILEIQERTELDCGEAVLTSSGDLAPRVRVIVHAVGPDYREADEAAKGSELLTAAYRNSLELAYDPNYQRQPNYVSNSVPRGKTFHSIAFPSISTGIYSAPLPVAASLALQTVQEFVEEFPDAFEEVRFVFLPPSKDPKTGPAFQEALDDLRVLDTRNEVGRALS